MIIGLLAQQHSAVVSGRRSCPPACPETSFLEELRASVQKVGLSVPATTIAGVASQQVLDWHMSRTAKDRHFYKQVVAQQLKRFDSTGITAPALQAAHERVGRSSRYQLLPAEGVVLRTPHTMFAGRNLGVEYFLERSLPALRRRNNVRPPCS